LRLDSSNGTAADRVQIWVNGVRQAVTITTQIGSGGDFNTGNTGELHTIGRLRYVATAYLDGYMAEIHFIDGTALDPTSFGEFDTNGIWRPIQVSGLTYGTNGFYLSFADNASTTTLGYDDAGSNDWTLNNFSVAAGAGNDSLEDTPTNNWCTLNPLTKVGSNTLSNGNLGFAGGGNVSGQYAFGSMFPESGQWYFECSPANTYTYTYIGVELFGSTTNFTGAAANSVGCELGSGNIYRNGANQGTGGTGISAGDTLMVAFEPSTGKVWMGRNGTWYNSGAPASGTGAVATIPTVGPIGLSATPYASSGTISFNFGQRAFAYTPPTGFVALCTANLPTPDIADPGAYMNAVLYTGTGSSLGVTGAGFQPDLVWIKSRSAATDHALYDAVRGVQKQIESNTTTDETTETTGLTAFGSGGFTVGALAQVNTSTATYVAWCWKEGVTPGFDIVTYTGNGSNRTINHNLGAVPKLIIVKALTTAGTDQGWPVYQAANTAAPETDYLLLNSLAATADDNTLWNDTAPTTTVFSVGTNALVNTNSDTYVAYLFAEVEGFSKFGSYTGNGSTDGPFVWCGFRPEFIMYKKTSNVGGWRMHDAARNAYNAADIKLGAEDSSAEASGVPIDIVSGGFKIRDSSSYTNAVSSTYIFAAFAQQPFSAPSNAR